MKLSDYVAQFLKDLGVGCIFGYQGANIAHMIDSITNADGIRFVTAYNEQGAAFAACGYAYATNGLGVALASSGPGAINLISGIANAYYDSIPCIFITGNVTRNTMKKELKVRQNAFQENDIVAMVKGVTKYSVTVFAAEDIRYHLEKAAFLARSGRCGPVLLDLPHDIQKSEVDPQALRGFSPGPECKESSDSLRRKTQDVMQLFQKARRPLLVVGGGATSERARYAIRELLKGESIPAVSTLRGLDIVSHDQKCFLGFAGAYGNRYANLAIKYSDAILVVGARLDERFIAVNDKSLFEKKQIIHVDIDPNELGHVLKETIQIHSSAEDFLEQMINAGGIQTACEKWMEALSVWRKRYPSEIDEKDFSLNTIISILTKRTKDQTLFFVDIGISQMSVAQSAYITGNQRIFTSAGHGAMGFSLPAAIGAAYAKGVSNVVCFVGDGAFHMNIQEMLMLSKGNLPVHVVVLNNGCLGMIRDYQEKAFCKRYAATIDEFKEVDYQAIAKAYGVDYLQVRTISDMEAAVMELNTQCSNLIEINLDENSNTCPQLGTDMFSQLPLLTEGEWERIEEEAQNASV